MQIIALFEQLATHAHYELEELLISQPKKIQEIFLTNNTTDLKSMFPDSEISADRTTIFQL